MWHAGERTSYKTLVENVKERDRLACLNLDGKIIFKWILGELDERAWTAFVQLRIG
jgi:hypothetical protein